ncbi:hypothetical protein [Myxosarcina sp. GI1]|uniref:hypothetical protein n=1 Tax=Myxosarcina sp. GI1 TaxID=1541065 RepID=UPI00056C3F45|nr:hypothetical protein [Myxosarcina sp. GI1]
MYVSPQIVVGFHGCDRTIADKVIQQNTHLSSSENKYDWLGHGIYFWEGSYERAFDCAKNSSKVSNPAVIGAFIRLGNCLDLLDTAKIEYLKLGYEILEQEANKLQIALPKNKSFRNGISFNRELDCEVIQRIHQFNNELIANRLNLLNIEGENKIQIQCHPDFIDSVRGMFPEGDEVYPGAGFLSQNHIQLCIVNPNCIIGYFNPIKQNEDYKKFSG